MVSAKAPSHKQALEGVTVDAAYAESELGSQRCRKKADFVIFDDGERVRSKKSYSNVVT